MIDIRVLVKLLFALAVLLVIAVLLQQIDAPLDPKASALLERAQPAESSEAYLYLMGIVAAKGEEPVSVGRTLHASIKLAEAVYWKERQTFSFEDYPERKKLPLPDGDLFCQSWTQGCIEQLFSNPASLNELLSVHEDLQQRYQVFLQSSDYATLTSPHLAEPFPPFQYLGKANRLWVLKSIATAKSSPDAGLTMLADNIRQLRQQMALQDLLVGKLVFVMLISENLDVASIVMHRKENTMTFTLPHLTQQERDFSRVMAREFAMAYDTMRSMDRHPEFLKADSPLPGWLVRAIFKPNVSANALLPIYLQAIEDAQMTADAFAERIRRQPKPEVKEDWLRNFAGMRLNRIASPDFNIYVGRLHDLDAKIRLFNQAGGSDASHSLEQQPEPYLSEDKRSLCVDGALPDERRLRCLRIRL